MNAHHKNSFCHGRSCFPLAVMAAAALGGCAGSMERAPPEIDWQRVQAIESQARRTGVQIIWMRFPEKNVSPATPAGKAADKSH